MKVNIDNTNNKLLVSCKNVNVLPTEITNDSLWLEATNKSIIKTFRLNTNKKNFIKNNSSLLKLFDSTASQKRKLYLKIGNKTITLEFNMIIFNPTKSRFEIQLFNKLPRYLNSKLIKIDFILIDSTLDNILPSVSSFVYTYLYSVIPQIPDYYKNYSFNCNNNNDLGIQGILSDFIINYYTFFENVESMYLHFVLILFQEKLKEITNCDSKYNSNWKTFLGEIIERSVTYVNNNNLIEAWSNQLGNYSRVSSEYSVYYTLMTTLVPFLNLNFTDKTEAKINRIKWNNIICSSIFSYITDPGLSFALKNIIPK
mgnify:CR=1 FL=1